MKNGAIMIIFLLILTNCNHSGSNSKSESTYMGEINKERFGMTKDGIPVDLYVMKNVKGMEVQVITLGGIITSWTAPDRDGQYENIVLGFDQLEDYDNEHPFFGALIGRYSNRIADGQFEINGQKFQLPINNSPNHLHGGDMGYDKVIWTVEETKTDNSGSHIKLFYKSPDGEMGYPGTLEIKVTYTLTNDNELAIEYKANTDKTTHCNLTHHSYFNLSGDFSKDILDHELTIDAHRYVTLNNKLIPTGELAEVEGTPFDFTEMKPIGSDINSDNIQLQYSQGYDHSWVLNGSGMRKVVRAEHPKSGRVLEVYTDEPGIQLYTGNFLDGSVPNPQGGFYERRTGFCLETQHFPDSPNQPNFPSTLLNPWELYQSRTTYKLLTVD